MIIFAVPAKTTSSSKVENAGTMEASAPKLMNRVELALNVAQGMTWLVISAYQ